MQPPDILYARSDGLHIAYQRFGVGRDVVIVPPLMSNIELGWEHELYRRILEHQNQHIRVLQFDKRGIGCSDRFEQIPTLEERIRDIEAVMDAEGVERADLIGVSEGGVMTQLFAARHPDRVQKLVLVNTAAGLGSLPHVADYIEPGEREIDLPSFFSQFERLVESWGVDPAFMVDWMAPSQRENTSLIRWMGRLQRQSATPADIKRQIDSILNLDATDVLSQITLPTLVVHVRGDQVLHPAFGRFLADRITGATYVELPGADHFLWFMDNWREMSNLIIEFLLEHPVTATAQRRFAAVLFTDLVDSTARSAKVGDDRWHGLLDSHDRICREVIDQHAGHVVKSTGDGFLALFDTPSQAVRAAEDIVTKLGAIDLGVRAGVHAGELELREDGDVLGSTVNIAARVEQKAGLGEVYVSAAVRDMLLGGEHHFADRGEHELKGVEGAWKLYALAP